MDGFPLIGLVPTGSIAFVLLAVITLYARQNHQDRKQYREDVANIEARHQNEVRSLVERHEGEMRSVRDEIRKLRESNEAVIAELDDERRKRWKAEDLAATYRSRFGVIAEGDSGDSGK